MNTSFMNFFTKKEITQRQFNWLEIILIVGFAIIPLLTAFPYRVNIFLSWEGAYRMSEGLVPFKDFGLPMGYGYWIIPAIFFKIFGPQMITLIKAQVFINIISGLAFRSILKSFDVKSGLRWLGIFLFVISYSFFNFWPWYNQSVIVFELIGIAWLLNYLFREKDNWKSYLFLIGATFFLFLSFFTKQDGGGLALLVASALVLYHTLVDKKYKDLALFIGSYGMWALIFILPLLPYGFGYWFNHGQPPHNSRIEMYDFIDVFFNESKWEKLYLLGILGVFIARLKDIKTYFNDKKSFMFMLFTLGILVEAILFQVTSYTPPNNNIFFHSFCVVFLASQINFSRTLHLLPNLTSMTLLVVLWWSSNFWKYVERKVQRFFPQTEEINTNEISRKNFMRPDTTSQVPVGMADWTFSDLKVFKNIYMPKSTVDGITRLMSRPEVKLKDTKILNMSELTPLAYEIGYEIERGKPLWYHTGVGIFDPQIDEYVKEIENDKYDLVLFEWAPSLNNFYPDEIRWALQKNYQLVDQFLAPRNPSDSDIEIYVRQTN